MRVGTWNLEGCARSGAVDLLLRLRAGVLLLTEVPPDLEVPGYTITELRQPTMQLGQHYAAVCALQGMAVERLEPPAVTSAAMDVDGTTYVSTVLPWPRAGAPYVGDTQAEQTVNAVAELQPWLTSRASLVWGGDWNHPMAGSLQGFTRRGQQRIRECVDALRLTVHTIDADAQGGKCRSVDHIASRHGAVPVEVVHGGPFSDHDAYVVELPG